ncbi:RNA polymerase sigma factor [Thalassoglobus neptunius]|uniref:RNA polymerase sigma factor n=1 Tax=Thalassoglobus neptunius TaxID=1938619 RepID=A0A5C5VQ16_9PLAN|nr:sigma-70 family RNA polymerase sigma factor [Thalassoglobus neptunius]TWT39881.1 RNA polymerase sigma factor [Thalassoglobus neptunius]
MDDHAKDVLYDRFVSLFARHERSIRSYIRSLLPTSNDADDVMQEVGLVCWKKFGTFEPAGSPEEFVRWACVIARFEVLRHRRNCARDRLVLSEGVLKLLASDAETRLPVAEAERQAVEQCLGKLPPPERRLLLSVHTPGDSIAKVAEELGQEVRRLYSKVVVLRDGLRQCVSRQLAELEK